MLLLLFSMLFSRTSFIRLTTGSQKECSRGGGTSGEGNVRIPFPQRAAGEGGASTTAISTSEFIPVGVADWMDSSVSPSVCRAGFLAVSRVDKPTALCRVLLGKWRIQRTRRRFHTNQSPLRWSSRPLAAL